MDSTGIRLECLRLAGGDLDQARKLWEFVTGYTTGPAVTHPGHPMRVSVSPSDAAAEAEIKRAFRDIWSGPMGAPTARFDVVGAHVVRSGGGKGSVMGAG